MTTTLRRPSHRTGDAVLLEQPLASDIQLIEVLKAVADPVRLTLITVMHDGEYHPCRAEVYAVDLHKSTLSHHFKVMREAGITSTRILGRNREMRLRKEDLDARFPGLVDSLVTAHAAGVHSGT